MSERSAAQTEPRPDRAILLTPPGVAAIAVVRLAGPGTRAFLSRHFSRPVAHLRAVHGQLRDGEMVLDDPVVVLDEQRDLADLNLHGGAWVVRALLDLAARSGFEVIETIQPPLHPMSVDASSEIERDVLTHLPMASTELALRVLLAQPRAWQRLLQSVSSPEPRQDDQAHERMIDPILADRSLHWLLHPPRVAIVGPANAGKSTLANQLFAQERSITADLPGTTRDWVGEMANLDGLAVMLVDTPGLRPTEDPVEAQAIVLARHQADRADLVVLVLDATVPLEPEQAALLEAYPAAIRVINKSDLAAAWEPARTGGIRTVATTGAGVDAVRAAIRRSFGCENLVIDTPRCWTPRQRTLLLSLKRDSAHVRQKCT